MWARIFIAIVPFLMLINANVQAQVNSKNSVSVAGECRMNVAADQGQLHLQVEALEKEVEKATQKAGDIYNKMKKSLEKLNIEDLQITTSGYQVYELKEWENNKSISKGFKASLGMKVESSKIDKFAEIIKLAGQQGITNVGSFTTFLSLEKQKKLAAECLKVAAQNAKDKAKVLAEELGAKIGKALYIAEVDASGATPQPVPMYSMMKSAAADSSGPEVNASEQEYSRKVNVTFELL